MKTQDLKKVIEEYIKIDSPSYAIMINGPWGSGKTHLVKGCFNEDKGVIYISLYGVSSLEQINDKIFTSLTSLDAISEEEIKKTSGFISNITKIFTEFDSSSAIGSVVSTVGSTIKSRVLSGLNKEITLVFDDLERASMNTSQALSCVNEFVEHQNLNAIILCDENNIKDDEYLSYKEKVVLYTYSIDRSPEEKATIAFKEIANVPDKILNKSKTELSRLLENITCNNLRTLKLAVTSYSRMVNSLNENNHDLKNSDKLVQLLFPCLAYAIGIKEMRLSDGDLEKFSNSNSRTTLQFQFSKNEIDTYYENLKTFNDEIVKKSARSIEIQSAHKLVCQGVMDYSSLRKDIEKWTPPTPFEFRLTNINDRCTDDVFEKTIRSGIDEIKSKSMTIDSPQTLINSIKNLYYFIKNKAIDYKIEALEIEIQDFVNYIIENRKYGNPDTKFIDIPNGNDFINKTVSNAILQIDKHRSENEIRELQNALILTLTPTDDDETSEAFRKLYNNATTPFIVIDFAPLLITKIKCAAPIQISDFHQLIEIRYSSSNIFQFLKTEIQALESIENELEKYEEDIPSSLSKFHLKKLIQTINHSLTTKELYNGE